MRPAFMPNTEFFETPDYTFTSESVLLKQNHFLNPL